MLHVQLSIVHPHSPASTFTPYTTATLSIKVTQGYYLRPPPAPSPLLHTLWNIFPLLPPYPLVTQGYYLCPPPAASPLLPTPWIIFPLLPPYPLSFSLHNDCPTRADTCYGFLEIVFPVIK